MVERPPCWMVPEVVSLAPDDSWPFRRSVTSSAATTRSQWSETPGAAGWPELGLVFESDATAGLVPVVH
jgi:hypothetical protein